MVRPPTSVAVSGSAGLVPECVIPPDVTFIADIAMMQSAPKGFEGVMGAM
jgi:hypothetical protein